MQVQIEGVQTADLTPGRIGSLYRGQQLVMFGHYWGDGEADVSLTGKVSGQPIQYRTRFAFPATATDNPEIERLWAFARIEDMLAKMDDFGEQADLKRAVIDLGVEYGLVTDYTSMLVLREEQFEHYGVKRRNRDRLAVEQAAQRQRAGRAAVSRRVDTQQPMYSSNRASHSGSGALGPWILLLVPPLLVSLARRRMAV